MKDTFYVLTDLEEVMQQQQRRTLRYLSKVTSAQHRDAFKVLHLQAPGSVEPSRERVDPWPTQRVPTIACTALWSFSADPHFFIGLVVLQYLQNRTTTVLCVHCSSTASPAVEPLRHR